MMTAQVIPTRSAARALMMISCTALSGVYTLSYTVADITSMTFFIKRGISMDMALDITIMITAIVRSFL